jgi:hypothetical protein
VQFQANGRRKIAETLIMIDIDCHSKGSYEGAVRCVEWLKNNGFPGLFWCRSTNGRGIHASLVIRKHQFGDVELDRALGNLEHWLQYQHHVQRWDVERIEIKARPPVFEWGLEKYELRNVQMGSLAKVPVDLLDRPEELMATTSLSVARLNRLGLEVPREWNRETLPTTNDGFGDISLDDIRLWQPETGSRVWCTWIERMAKIGLVEDDSMGKVVFELAKWLLWVELHDRDDRLGLATSLLQGYVLSKHNGHVSRLNDGHEAEVLSQLERIVASAADISQDSAELFGRIRQGREEGKYWRPIRIVPLISAIETEGSDEEQYNCSTYYSLPIRDDVLPASIEEKLLSYAKQWRMRRSQGDYPFVRFSRRLLNLLWDRKGSARLSTALLTTWVTNVHQQNDFKQALRHLNLLRDWTGTYRARSASCLYRLTDCAMDLLTTGDGITNARTG